MSLASSEKLDQRISAMQSIPFTGATGKVVATPTIGYSDVLFYFKGAAHAGWNLTFEISVDSTDGLDGTWFPTAAVLVSQLFQQPVLATGALPTNGASVWQVNDPGAAWARARITAATSGTLDAWVTATAGSLARTVAVHGHGALQLGKAEDTVHASGDVGMYVLGVRAPATPAAPSSAAGDYTSVLVDAEGKLIIAATADPSVTWQSNTALTLTTDVALKAAAAAGIRNYVTDVTVENTGAAAARFLLRDGTTTIWTVTIPAGSTLMRSFNTPLRGAAATAVNGQLGAAGTVTVSLSGFLGV